MQETEYRGYRILYHCPSDWFANIFRRGSDLVMRNGTVTATRSEGKDVLLQRARARIDAEET